MRRACSSESKQGAVLFIKHMFLLPLVEMSFEGVGDKQHKPSCPNVSIGKHVFHCSVMSKENSSFMGNASWLRWCWHFLLRWLLLADEQAVFSLFV